MCRLIRCWFYCCVIFWLAWTRTSCYLLCYHWLDMWMTSFNKHSQLYIPDKSSPHRLIALFPRGEDAEVKHFFLIDCQSNARREHITSSEKKGDSCARGPGDLSLNVMKESERKKKSKFKWNVNGTYDKPAVPSYVMSSLFSLSLSCYIWFRESIH